MVQRTVNVEDHEEWMSGIDGVIYIKKLDRRGDLSDVPIKPHGKIRLLPEERRLNQEMAAEESLDVFTNGHLIPTVLVETSEDFEQLKGNPNHLTATDMEDILSDPAALQEQIASVSNVGTLRRLLTIANGPDSEVRVKDVRAIEARLDEVMNPADDDDETTVVEIEQIGGGGKTALATRAPKSDAPANPGAGRRSTRKHSTPGRR